MTSTPSGPSPEDDATPEYLELIRAANRDWPASEHEGDDRAQLSSAARRTIREAVRADSRQGAHVEMPPTPAGPFTVSEATLRSVVRSAVDAVPGTLALRTSADHAVSTRGGRTRGRPERLRVRVSAALSTPDLPALAGRVRGAVTRSCREHLGLADLTVDIHIEDLHEGEHHGR